MISPIKVIVTKVRKKEKVMVVIMLVGNKLYVPYAVLDDALYLVLIERQYSMQVCK